VGGDGDGETSSSLGIGGRDAGHLCLATGVGDLEGGDLSVGLLLPYLALLVAPPLPVFASASCDAYGLAW
jgi:hypothetical protein